MVFGAIFGFVYAPLVITGLHHMSNAIDMQLIADFGGTMLWPMIALSNIAQGSAVLGMIYLQRKNAAAQEVNVPSCISCYLGVTEPAMFGVNLKFHFPVYLRHDWICHRSGRLCGNFHHGQRHRCRRHPWYFVNPARLYAQLCAVHGHCHRRPLCADRHRRQEKRRCLIL